MVWNTKPMYHGAEIKHVSQGLHCLEAIPNLPHWRTRVPKTLSLIGETTLGTRTRSQLPGKEGPQSWWHWTFMPTWQELERPRSHTFRCAHEGTLNMVAEHAALSHEPGSALDKKEKSGSGILPASWLAMRCDRLCPALLPPRLPCHQHCLPRLWAKALPSKVALSGVSSLPREKWWPSTMTWPCDQSVVNHCHAGKEGTALCRASLTSMHWIC